ncbi:hypothetical protein SprV_0100359700 [Sparganum proliferum]
MDTGHTMEPMAAFKVLLRATARRLLLFAGPAEIQEEETRTLNQLIQRPEDLPAPDENAYMEDRWCQLREAAQSTVVVVLSRAHRQHMGWFQDNSADVRNLIDKKNGLHTTYRCIQPTDANKEAFYQFRRLAQRLREMQYVWMARKADEIQGYVDRNETKNFFAEIKAIYGPQGKETGRFSALMDRRF